MTLTAERLRELLHYDPRTGAFTWKVSRGKGKAGSVAGRLDKRHGYWKVGVDGTEYRASRLAWFYVHGTWPEGEIDHRDRNELNDTIANLRDVTHLVNAQNVGGKNTRKGKWPGVCFHKGRYLATMKSNWKSVYVGRFRCETAAHLAYLRKKLELHPEASSPLRINAEAAAAYQGAKRIAHSFQPTVREEAA